MISLNNQRIVLVGNVRGTSVINIINGHNSLLLSESNFNKDSRMQYALGNFWINRGIADREKIHIRLMAHADIHFRFAGKSFLILNDKSIENPISVDYLIITNKAYGAEKDAFCSLIKAKQIIIDSSVPDYKSDKWLSLSKESKIDCWIVSKQGAWMFEKKMRSKDRQRQFLAGQ